MGTFSEMTLFRNFTPPFRRSRRWCVLVGVVLVSICVSCVGGEKGVKSTNSSVSSSPSKTISTNFATLKNTTFKIPLSKKIVRKLLKAKAEKIEGSTALMSTSTTSTTSSTTQAPPRLEVPQKITSRSFSGGVVALVANETEVIPDQIMSGTDHHHDFLSAVAPPPSGFGEEFGYSSDVLGGLPGVAEARQSKVSPISSFPQSFEKFGVKDSLLYRAEVGGRDYAPGSIDEEDDFGFSEFGEKSEPRAPKSGYETNSYGFTSGNSPYSNSPSNHHKSSSVKSYSAYGSNGPAHISSFSQGSSGAGFKSSPAHRPSSPDDYDSWQPSSGNNYGEEAERRNGNDPTSKLIKYRARQKDDGFSVPSTDSSQQQQQSNSRESFLGSFQTGDMPKMLDDPKQGLSPAFDSMPTSQSNEGPQPSPLQDSGPPPDFNSGFGLEAPSDEMNQPPQSDPMDKFPGPRALGFGIGPASDEEGVKSSPPTTNLDDPSRFNKVFGDASNEDGPSQVDSPPGFEGFGAPGNFDGPSESPEASGPLNGDGFHINTKINSPPSSGSRGKPQFHREVSQDDDGNGFASLSNAEQSLGFTDFGDGNLQSPPSSTHTTDFPSFAPPVRKHRKGKNSKASKDGSGPSGDNSFQNAPEQPNFGPNMMSDNQGFDAFSGSPPDLSGFPGRNPSSPSNTQSQGFNAGFSAGSNQGLHNIAPPSFLGPPPGSSQAPFNAPPQGFGNFPSHAYNGPPSQSFHGGFGGNNNNNNQGQRNAPPPNFGGFPGTSVNSPSSFGGFTGNHPGPRNTQSQGFGSGQSAHFSPPKSFGGFTGGHSGGPHHSSSPSSNFGGFPGNSQGGSNGPPSNFGGVSGNNQGPSNGPPSNFGGFPGRSQGPSNGPPSNFGGFPGNSQGPSNGPPSNFGGFPGNSQGGSNGPPSNFGGFSGNNQGPSNGPPSNFGGFPSNGQSPPNSPSSNFGRFPSPNLGSPNGPPSLPVRTHGPPQNFGGFEGSHGGPPSQSNFGGFPRSNQGPPNSPPQSFGGYGGFDGNSKPSSSPPSGFGGTKQGFHVVQPQSFGTPSGPPAHSSQPTAPHYGLGPHPQHNPQHHPGPPFPQGPPKSSKSAPHYGVGTGTPPQINQSTRNGFNGFSSPPISAPPATSSGPPQSARANFGGNQGPQFSQGFTASGDGSGFPGFSGEHGPPASFGGFQPAAPPQHSNSRGKSIQGFGPFPENTDTQPPKGFSGFGGFQGPPTSSPITQDGSFSGENSVEQSPPPGFASQGFNGFQHENSPFQGQHQDTHHSSEGSSHSFQSSEGLTKSTPSDGPPPTPKLQNAGDGGPPHNLHTPPPVPPRPHSTPPSSSINTVHSSPPHEPRQDGPSPFPGPDQGPSQDVPPPNIPLNLPPNTPQSNLFRPGPVPLNGPIPGPVVLHFPPLNTPHTPEHGPPPPPMSHHPRTPFFPPPNTNTHDSAPEPDHSPNFGPPPPHNMPLTFPPPGVVAIPIPLNHEPQNGENNVAGFSFGTLQGPISGGPSVGPSGTNDGPGPHVEHHPNPPIHHHGSGSSYFSPKPGVGPVTGAVLGGGPSVGQGVLKGHKEDSHNHLSLKQKLKFPIAKGLKTIIELGHKILAFYAKLSIPKDHYLRVISFAGVYLLVAWLYNDNQHLLQPKCESWGWNGPEEFAFHAGPRFVPAIPVDQHMQQEFLSLFRGLEGCHPHQKKNNKKDKKKKKKKNKDKSSSEEDDNARKLQLRSDDSDEEEDDHPSSAEANYGVELNFINDMCPRSRFFYGFSPMHLEAWTSLARVFIAQKSPADVLHLARSLLCSHSVNPKVWYLALMAASFERPDMTGFTLAHPLDAMPDWFVPGHLIEGEFDRYRGLARNKRQASLLFAGNFSQILRQKGDLAETTTPNTPIPVYLTQLRLENSTLPSLVEKGWATNVNGTIEDSNSSKYVRQKAVLKKILKKKIGRSDENDDDEFDAGDDDDDDDDDRNQIKKNPLGYGYGFIGDGFGKNPKIPLPNGPGEDGYIGGPAGLGGGPGGGGSGGNQGGAGFGGNQGGGGFGGNQGGFGGGDGDDGDKKKHKKGKGKGKGKKKDKKKKCIIVDGSVGLDNGPENKLWYWREDFMVNQHHWYWHQVFGVNATRHADRRAEIFFFMHRNFLARYNAERLSNGFGRTIEQPLYPGAIIEDGYNSHLKDFISGQWWTPRAPHLPLQDIMHIHDPDFARDFRIADVVGLYNKFVWAIKIGKLKTPDGKFLPIRYHNGLQPLANTVEATNISVNPFYYDAFGLHNLGHTMIGLASDPEYGKHLPTGIMTEAAVSMRDVSFYPYHTIMDNLFEKFKQTLLPYRNYGGEWPLQWHGVDIVDLKLVSTGVGDHNSLTTFYVKHKFLLEPGVDRSIEKGVDMAEICAVHLDHAPFQYHITIDRKKCAKSKSGQGTVRIFMAPRYDEEGKRLPLVEQRRLMFQLDGFQVDLKVGRNVITRNSRDNSLTRPWTRSLTEYMQGPDPSGAADYCGCGWPHHLYVPKGNVKGMPFDLFVMVTNFDEDFVADDPHDLEIPESCNSPYIFCSRPRRRYPDARPMGYPFDRSPYRVPAKHCGPGAGLPDLLCKLTGKIFTRPVATLEEFVSGTTNMAMTVFEIKHIPKVIGKHYG